MKKGSVFFIGALAGFLVSSLLISLLVSDGEGARPEDYGVGS